MNLGHILTYPKPKSDSEDLSKWENGNKQVRHTILSTLTNELFDVYFQYKVAKEIWDALTKIYIVEDARTQKYAIGYFRKFQIIEDRDVSSQIHDYHMLIHDLVIEGIYLPEPFVVGYLIETFPNYWEDYKNIMKHKRKQISLKDVIINIRVEEQNKTRDKAKRAKELSSKANVVEKRPKPKFNRPKRQNPMTKPNSSNKVQNPTFKKRSNCFICGKPGHHAPQCRNRKRLERANPRKLLQK